MSRDLNARIKHLEMPARIRKLPISDEGYPVPAFVEWIDGKPDFRVINGQHFRRCVEIKRCWLCGEPLGKFMTFVIGPMCGINRVSSEPPCHHDCALYSVKACPFLSQPRMRRNEKDLPEGGVVAGIGIKRNPGVTLLWTTDGYRLFHAGGPLVRIGEPLRIEFFREGRRATLAEIDESIESGLPLLRDMAQREGKAAVKQLEQQIAWGMKLMHEAVR